MALRELGYGELAGIERYPTLRPRANLPVATRMVLACDGSTTVLLRVLADSDIAAETIGVQGWVVSRMYCPELSAVFGRSEAISVRRSRLRDSNGKLVSENVITYRESDRDVLIPRGDIPFGLHTRQLGLYERRRVFRVGVTASTFGALPAHCAARVYEIGFSTGQQVLVHEVFAPRVVPTGSPAAGRKWYAVRSS